MDLSDLNDGDPDISMHKIIKQRGRVSNRDFNAIFAKLLEEGELFVLLKKNVQIPLSATHSSAHKRLCQCADKGENDGLCRFHRSSEGSDIELASYRIFLRTVQNMFILNLALADLIVCIFSLPITPITSIRKNWYFGDQMCHSLPWIQAKTAALMLYRVTATRDGALMAGIARKMNERTLILTASVPVLSTVQRKMDSKMDVLEQYIQSEQKLHALQKVNTDAIHQPGYTFEVLSSFCDAD
ncbi:hypothetical protein NECAME_07646 [Necator americanus]|uniref:G-protein coupled receptors family 1 profile domain-containing protein n=1 Tax=Necator americanus TaxID=51031 RepID=W2TPL5_NECAM|nr:hypothetical protein NECAME_07646 [Necator americanus]ETN82932.1 hypothetical protein NECAME_07646 [Necator americanus]